MDCPFKTPDGATVEHVALHSGDQFRFAFANGWGASVVKHDFSYGNEDGLWELAVIGKGGRLDYSHPVSAGDVRGRLSVEDVDRLVAEIAATTDSTPMLGDDPATAEEKLERGLNALGSMAKWAAGGGK